MMDITAISRLAALPPQGHEEDWLNFITHVLKMEPCYLPAAQEVLRQSGWRRHTGKGQNTIGYIRTATYREALKMGLALDRFNKNEPRVLTKDVSALTSLRVPRGKNHDAYIEKVSGESLCGLGRTEHGTWRAVDTADDYVDSIYERVPGWLKSSDEDGDSVNWELVAKHSVEKPRMAPRVAKVLALRSKSISRPVAMAAAACRKEAKEIEAAWRWVDRHWEDRIRPLFRMGQRPEMSSGPNNQSAGRHRQRFVSPAECLRRIQARHLPPDPPPATAEPAGDELETVRRILQPSLFSLLRPDVDAGWNGTILTLSRTGTVGESRSISIYADSLGEAEEIVRQIAAQGSVPEIFRAT